MSAPLTIGEDVARALRTAFEERAVEHLAPLAGGRSGATMLAFVVEGKGYVLRRPDPTRPMHQARSERQIACTRIAAARGIAPSLLYVDVATGITIESKVDGTPFRRSAAGATERIARALRTLHDGPAFPSGFTTVDVVRYFDGEVRARSGTRLPAALVQAVTDVARATERFGATVACHNDLNPGNILDDDDRIYLIDWDTACAGDPFVDLAQLGVFSFATPEARVELLEAYLGRTPTETEQARSTLARVLALGFYAAAFACTAVVSGRSLTLHDALPLQEVLPRFGRGEASPEVVAASLHHEMMAAYAQEAFAAAMFHVT